jgi:hypothetical protein
MAAERTEPEHDVHETLFNEILLAATEEALKRPLRTMPRAEPLPEQERIVERAFTQARAHGLRLPATTTIRWVEGRETHHGETWLDDRGRLGVAFNVNVMPGRLFEVALHEAQHIHDFGMPEARRMGRLELEQRAFRFVRQVLGYRG